MSNIKKEKEKRKLSKNVNLQAQKIIEKQRNNEPLTNSYTSLINLLIFFTVVVGVFAGFVFLKNCFGGANGKGNTILVIILSIIIIVAIAAGYARKLLNKNDKNK